MRCPFKIGEKIICINKNWDGTPCTISKIYIVESGYRYITIKGDHNSSFVPHWNDFVTLKEYRKLKLIKLNQK